MNTQLNNNYGNVPMGQGNSQWPNPPASSMPFGNPAPAPGYQGNAGYVGNMPPAGPPAPPPGGDDPDRSKRRRTIGWIIAVALINLLLLLLYLLLPSRCTCNHHDGGSDTEMSDDRETSGPDDHYFDSIPDDPDSLPSDTTVSDEVERAIGQGGQLQFTVSWSRNDIVDIDAHCIEPSGFEIYFATREQRSPSGGMLDIDNKERDRGRIEHITYADCSTMSDGTYTFSAVNYTGGRNSGVKAYLTIGDKTYQYQINSLSAQEQRVNVAKVTIQNGQVVDINHLLACNEVDVQP